MHHKCLHEKWQLNAVDQKTLIIRWKYIKILYSFLLTESNKSKSTTKITVNESVKRMVPVLYMKPAQLVDFSSPMNIAWDGTWHNDLMAAWSLAGRETVVTPYNHINLDCPIRQRSIVWLYHWISLSATASETVDMWRCEASHQGTRPCGACSKLRRPLELHVANSKRVSLMFLFMTLHTERCNQAAKKKKNSWRKSKTTCSQQTGWIRGTVVKKWKEVLPHSAQKSRENWVLSPFWHTPIKGLIAGLCLKTPLAWQR